MKKALLSIIAATTASLGFAMAYTGPGLGLATIAVVLGFIGSIFVALFAVVWYPVKRLLKKRKSGAAAEVETTSAASASSDAKSATPVE